MFRVTLPSNDLYVTPEQLPRLLANIAETRYVAASGEYLQTVTTHEPVHNVTTATLLIKQPFETVAQEARQYQELWERERNKVEKLTSKLAKKKKVK